MKKPSSSPDVATSQPAHQTKTETQKQVADAEHQQAKTTTKSRSTTDENSLSTTDITILKNYSQFFVELS